MGTKDNFKILAATATHNRLELLKRNLLAVLNQTRKPDAILVIDNDSTDGTDEWLKKQNFLTYIRQPNTGSAGAQARAMKFAIENNYDYAWLMDDDGFPSKDALEKLVLRLKDEKFDALNSIVLSENNPDKLFCYLDMLATEKKNYFRIYDFVNAKKYSKNNLLRGYLYLYNGSLLSVEAIKKIGFPDERLFINGEEVEYFLRMKRKNLNMAICVDSIYYHPVVRNYKESLFRRMIITEEPALRHYFIFRNRPYIAKINNYRFYDIKFFISQCLHYLKNFEIKGLILLFIAFYHGINEKFLTLDKIKSLVGKIGIRK